ncbi:MAG: tetratricopeptide repeat protein [Candidatus Omnitrophica bacterium]|nr:tetratricopeptide repeat protein [Candidatus Omnitrophota bacterium]
MAARDGEFEKAIEFFKKAIEIDPRFAPAYNSLGLIHQTWEQGSIKESLRYFKLATDVDSNSVESWNNLARAYYSQGSFVLSEKTFGHSLKLRPEQPDIEIAIGWVYLLGESRAEEAIDHFERGLKTVDNNMAHYGLGLAYVLQGEKFKVLEQITALRQRSLEPEAARLEAMVRSDVKIASQPGTPLVAGKDIGESLFDKELQAFGKSKFNPDGSPKGIQVRVRGPLW